MKNMIEKTVLENSEMKVEFTLWSDGNLNYKQDTKDGKKSRKIFKGIEYDTYDNIVNETLNKMRQHSETTCEVW